MEPEWLRDPAVVGNIASLAKNREVKWTWKLPDGKQIGIRQTRIAWSRDFERWITMLGIDQRHLDIFISTNQLDWKALPELPPPVFLILPASGMALSEDEINILIKNEFETDTDVGALHP